MYNNIYIIYIFLYILYICHNIYLHHTYTHMHTHIGQHMLRKIIGLPLRLVANDSDIIIKANRMHNNCTIILTIKLSKT